MNIPPTHARHAIRLPEGLLTELTRFGLRGRPDVTDARIACREEHVELAVSYRAMWLTSFTFRFRFAIEAFAMTAKRRVITVRLLGEPEVVGHGIGWLAESVATTQVKSYLEGDQLAKATGGIVARKGSLLRIDLSLLDDATSGLLGTVLGWIESDGAEVELGGLRLHLRISEIGPYPDLPYIPPS